MSGKLPDGYETSFPVDRDARLGTRLREPDELDGWQPEPWSTFRDASAAPQRYLVDELWPEEALGFISAPPKAGKTWLALALAIAVATGRPLFGSYRVPEPRPVLYIALEGHRNALRARIGALARGIGIDPDGDELERLHLLYRPHPFNIADPEPTAALVCAADAIAAALVSSTCTGRPPAARKSRRPRTSR